MQRMSKQTTDKRVCLEKRGVCLLKRRAGASTPYVSEKVSSRYPRDDICHSKEGSKKRTEPSLKKEEVTLLLGARIQRDPLVACIDVSSKKTKGEKKDGTSFFGS